jgi:hypothetical protein
MPLGAPVRVACATLDQNPIAFAHRSAYKEGNDRREEDVMHRVFMSTMAVLVAFVAFASDPGQAPTCTDADGDGYFAQGGCGTPVDCNDADPIMHPGAPEVCDGYDNDCDGAIDNRPSCQQVCDQPFADAQPRLVTSKAASMFPPSLVWTGSGYGAAWVDRRNGLPQQIYFARLDRYGDKVGSDLRVSPGPQIEFDQSLAWTGSEFGVVWRDWRPQATDDLYLARLDGSGQKMGPDVRVTDSPGASANPSLVWAGSQYGLSWTENYDGHSEIYFQRLYPDGIRIGDVVRLTRSEYPSTVPSLAWNGSLFGVAWQHYDGVNWQVYFTRLDALGNPASAVISVTEAPSFKNAPRLAAAGTEFGVAWSDGRDGHNEVYFARIGPDGNKLGEEVRVTNGTGGSIYPALSWAGNEYGISWSYGRDGRYEEIYFCRLDAMGRKIGGDIRVKPDVSKPIFAEIVWTGTRFGVAWFDQPLFAEILFANVNCHCPDLDADGYSNCDGDCDDNDATVFPGAPQLCDGKNNDCNDSTWPAVPVSETDPDHDGYAACLPWIGNAPGIVGGADCAPDDPAIHPDAPEVCNGIDDNCNGLVDEDGAGVDSDGDGVPGACDACPNTSTGEIVNAAGCSISQLVPSSWPWKNHGEYVSAVARVAGEFVAQGLITEAEKAAIVSAAARSDVGRRRTVGWLYPAFAMSSPSRPEREEGPLFSSAHLRMPSWRVPPTS